MSETLQSNDPLASAYQNVKSAIESRGIGPDDAEQLYLIVKPLESALKAVGEEPSGETVADKIARLLWFKGHIDNFNAPFVLWCVKDKDPLVRTVAMSALKTFLAEPTTVADEKLLFQAQRAVQEQSRNETSPLRLYILEDLSGELNKRLSQARRQVTASPTNPFIAGLPIRDDKLFFGRDRLVGEIRDCFQRKGVKGLVLFGARRTGKTSLLLHVQRGALGDDFAPVFINVQNSAGKTALVPMVLRALGEQWPNLIDPLGHAMHNDVTDFDLLRDAVGAVVRQLGGKKLLLMFDEYEELDSFLPDQGSVARLQGLFEDEPKLLGLYAGPKPLNEVMNRNLLTLLDNCEYLPITFLEKEDGERLIREPAAGVLEFSDAAVSKIQELCGGHPFYIQLLCQSIFTLKAGDGVVRDGDVETVVKRLIANPPPHLVLTWKDLEGNDQLVASALASVARPERGATEADVVRTLREQQFPRIPSKATIQKGLAALRRVDLIRKSGEGSPAHVFTMDFVRRWIADSRTVWDLLEERRKDAMSRTAPFWRRLSATGLDILITCLPQFLGVIWDGAYYVIFLPLLYYSIFLAVSDRTAGMRVLNLRLVSKDGTQVPWWRSLFFSLFLTLEATSVGLFIVATRPDGGKAGALAAVLFVVGLINQLQIAIHWRHRGLFDRLAQVLVTYEPPSDKANPWKR